MGYRSYIAFRGNDFDDARDLCECIKEKAEELMEHFDRAERDMDAEGYRRGYRHDIYDGNRYEDGYRGRRDSYGRYR